MSAKQRCVHHSKTCCQTLKHFDNVFATGGNNIAEVFESLTTSGTKWLPFFLHASCLIKDIIACKDQRENVQIIDKSYYERTPDLTSCYPW